MSPRLTSFVALAALAVALGAAVLASGRAEASGTKVVCQQVLQRPGAVDEQFVANFVSEQLAQGRERFTTVTGISTVICAY